MTMLAGSASLLGSPARIATINGSQRSKSVPRARTDKHGYRQSIAVYDPGWRQVEDTTREPRVNYTCSTYPLTCARLPLGFRTYHPVSSMWISPYAARLVGTRYMPAAGLAAGKTATRTV
jgi:hypothetical protein